MHNTPRVFSYVRALPRCKGSPHASPRYPGEAVVLELSSRLPQELGPYNWYVDNFFTSLDLFQELSNRNIGCTGTIRENRTRKCPLLSSKEMGKMKRVSHQPKNTGSLLICKWHDNNIVTVTSNCHGVSPLSKANRGYN